MGHKETIDKIRPELEKTLLFLGRELAKIRTSRATSSLVEDIPVDCSGTKLPVKQLGVISAQGPRQIVIQPWDRSYLEPILKAISQSGAGLTASADKDVIRINLPQLSEEFRQDLLRTLAVKQEEARKTIRRWREEAWKAIQDGFREGKVREDDKFRAKDELQKLIDEYSKKIDEAGERKKKEIME